MTSNSFAEIEPMLRVRTTFRHWSHEKIRFSDTDKIGHVNNAAYAVYCETGRVEFNQINVFPYLDDSFGGLVARIAYNIRAETFHPNTVDIGTGVVAIGRTSFTLGQGLFVGDGCVATAEGVIVIIDRDSRKPTPLPDQLRSSLRAWLLPNCLDN